MAGSLKDGSEAKSTYCSSGGPELTLITTAYSHAMVEQAFNHSTLKSEAAGSLSSRLVYRVNSRTSKATQGNPVLKIKSKQNQKKTCLQFRAKYLMPPDSKKTRI